MMPGCRRVGVFFLIIPLVCCEEGSRGQDIAAIHPTKDLLLSSDHPQVNEVSVSSLQEVEIPEWLAALTVFPEPLALGSFDGPEAAELGEIIDAEVSASGEVVLLDLSFGTLRAISADGRPLAVVGGLGGGPGEFVEPVGLDLGPDGTLVVADAARQLHRFRRVESSWEYRDRIPIGFLPEDVCELGGDRRVVVGPHLSIQDDSVSLVSSATTHLLSETGEVLTSFGVPYHSESMLALSYLTTAKLACDQRSESLWVAFANLGEIHAMRESGEVEWITRIADLEYPPLIENFRGGIRPDMDRVEKIEVISNIVYSPPGVLFVGVESRSVARLAEGDHGVAKRTYVLETDSGKGIGFLDGHTVLSGEEGVFVLYQESPVPRVAFLRSPSFR